MATRLTAEQCLARAHALEPAADHLGMSWTGNKTENAEGKAIAASLRADAMHWRREWRERGGKPAIFN